MFAVELIDTGQATPSYQWSQVERLPLRKLERSQERVPWICIFLFLSPLPRVAAYTAACLAGESPVSGIGCLPE